MAWLGHLLSYLNPPPTLAWSARYILSVARVQCLAAVMVRCASNELPGTDKKPSFSCNVARRVISGSSVRVATNLENLEYSATSQGINCMQSPGKNCSKQNCVTRCSFRGAKISKIRLRPGLFPGPHCGSLLCSPQITIII